MIDELDLEELTRPGAVVPIDLMTTAALVKYVLLQRTALEAADYYIDRMEAVQRRRVVRDMPEAMEGYKSARRALEKDTK